MSERLTPAETRVLTAIRILTRSNGYPPTVRELCHAVGVQSTGTMQAHLQSLHTKGHIDRSRGRARTLTTREDDDVRTA